VLGLVSAKID